MSDFGDHDPVLETLLRTARVRAPSTGLDSRLDAIFANADSPRRRLLPLAIAAGVAVVLLPAVWLLRSAGRQPVTARLPAMPVVEPPLRIERDVSRVFDDGVVAVSENTPYQQIRRQTVRDIWYIDPQTHARLLVRIPIERILVQKVEAF